MREEKVKKKKKKRIGKRKENVSLICNLEKEIKGEKKEENFLLYLLFGLEKEEKGKKFLFFFFYF